jgi:hypothetical protein
MQRTVRLKACQFLVVGIYIALALGCLARWTQQNWHAVTGDEPHYLVMASGIARFGTLEQRKPYAHEFATREIFAAGLARADAEPNQFNAHSISGPHGLFNIHNVGLPLLLALPFAIGGVIGAKIFLVLTSAVIALLAWHCSAGMNASQHQRAAAALAGACGMPFISAAAQVYPDLPAGVLALAALYWLRVRRADAALPADITVALLLAALPWLQIKFSALALVAATGLAMRCLQQHGTLRRAAVFIGAVLLSLLGVACYNHYAFGAIAGPYRDPALAANATALMVFLGLHFDQFHGLLLQNPAYFAAVLFLAPYARQHRLEACVCLAMYLAIVVPNAMHTTWYGGYSFAGRFMWTGAAILLPATVFGLIRLAQLSNGRGIIAVCVLIAFNAYQFRKYTLTNIDFYNIFKQAYWPETAQTLFPTLKAYLPVFQDAGWAFVYPANIAVLIFAAGLVVIGSLYRRSGRIPFERLLAGGVALLALPLVFAPSMPQPTTSALVFAARSLPSAIGWPEADALAASGATSGYLSFGPYIPLASGRFHFAFDYSATSSAREHVGHWDVFIPSLNTVIASGNIKAGVQRGSIEGTFSIDDDTDNENIEIRTFYNGDETARLSIRSLSIKRIDGARR